MNEYEEYFDDETIQEEYDEEYVNKLNNMLKINTNSYYNKSDTSIKSAPESSIVRSDLEFIKSLMGELNEKINKNLSFNQKQHSFSSINKKNNLFDTMNRISNKYFNAEKIIMEKLENEAEFNISVGEAYNKLDEELKKEARNI